MASRALLALGAAWAGLVLLAPAARADGAPTATEPRGEAAPHEPVPEVAEVEPKKWEFSLTAFGFDVRHEDGYAYASLLADRDRLHLEARYGYEAPETASLWVGYTFEAGERLALEATPMVGGVFGGTSGLAAGYEASLTYGRLELYTEGEFVFDLDEDEGSFYYSWSELTFAPTERWKVGLVLQRTKAYATALDVQWGFLLGLTFEKVDVTAYVLDPAEPDTTLALSLTVRF
jgi:hypothetical protein